MDLPRFASDCRRAIVDAQLAASPGAFPALLAELRDARPDWELLLYDAPHLEDAALRRIDPEGEGGLAALDRLQADGSLEQALLLSGRERLLGWARRAGLPALDAAVGGATSLGEQISPHALVLRDAVALLLAARRQSEGRPFLVGVNGIDKSGKTGFATALAARLAEVGLPVEQVALDDFTAEKKERRAKGYPEPEGLYRKYYAMERLKEQLLLPLRQARELPFELNYDVYDPGRERVTGRRRLALEPGGVLLLEGPFLFQADSFGYYDFRIYLVSDFERALELALGALEGKRRTKREQEFQRRELAAQSLYLKQEAPWKRAQLVLRGFNSDAPRIESARLQDAQPPTGVHER
jgi:uridine kinase